MDWKLELVPVPGGLEGLTGHGLVSAFGAPHGSRASFELDYELP